MPKKTTIAAQTIPRGMRRLVNLEVARGASKSGAADYLRRLKEKKELPASEKTIVGLYRDKRWLNSLELRKYEKPAKLEFLMQRARAIDFLRKVQILKDTLPKRIPKLFEPQAKRDAETKLRKLLEANVEYGPWQYTGRRKFQGGVVQRFERLGTFLGRLNNKKAKYGEIFVGWEALVASVPKTYSNPNEELQRKTDPDGQGPGDVALEKSNWGSSAADWGSAGHYTCRIFFDESAFGHNQQMGHENWGYIKATKSDPILGLQVFDPNPETLLRVAKHIARVRPKQPMPIIDVYGNVIYP